MANDNCALVLEGGGYRGIYTAGVLDVLMENNVYGFSDIWGTSAGALNGVNYKSHSIGRQCRVSLAFRDDKRMMSLYSYATTGSIVGNDFLYETVQNEIDPFDSETFETNPTRLWACSTDLVFGTPAYFQVEKLPRDVAYAKASASLPLVSEAVSADGHLLVDGGTADSVPIEVALGIDTTYAPDDEAYTPADKAVVVLTQPRDYVKSPVTGAKLAPYKRKYAEYPLFVKAFASRFERYNAQRQRLFELEREGKIVLIAPEHDLGLAKIEDNGEKLLHAYLMGRQDGAKKLAEIKDFIA